MRRTCGVCRRSLRISEFTKSQLKKWKARAKCKNCVINKGSKYFFDHEITSNRIDHEENDKIMTKKRKLSYQNKSGLKRKRSESVYVPASRVKRVHQLGDGHCLYRSLVYGLKERGMSHLKLRHLLASWVMRNKNLRINGTEISKWIRWENHCDVVRYCSMQRKNSSAWGGQIELCAFSHLFRCNVDVFQFQQERNEYKIVTKFPSPSGHTNKVVNLLYVNKNHYDALLVQD